MKSSKNHCVSCLFSYIEEMNQFSKLSLLTAQIFSNRISIDENISYRERKNETND